MSVSLEKIDMLMERANISYKEAKDALEMHNGDMVEALIYLESSNKTAPKVAPKHVRVQAKPHAHGQRTARPENDFFEDVKKFIAKMHKTSFVIRNKSKKVLDIPLTIAALIILFTVPVSFFLLILPYLFGYQISILDAEGKNMNFEKTFEFGQSKKEEEKQDQDRML